MATLGWILVIVLFAVGMAGTVIPVLPGVIAIFAAFFVYGWLIGFEPFGFWFWALESSILLAVFVGDYLIGALGVKKFGGSRASVWGSTIGLIAGPFVIPVAGLLAGPFIGAFVGELLTGSNIFKSAKVGIGAVIGFFSSVAVKVVLQVIMIVLFLLWVF